MARIRTPLQITDLSDFTKSLRQSLMQNDSFPSHSQLLTQVAKAAGYRNYQSLKAEQDAAATQGNPPAIEAMLVQPTTPLPPPDPRVLRVFDTEGRLVRWPKQDAVRRLCLWVLWTRIPARQSLTEKQVNTILQDANLFGDHVLLRRTMVDYQFMDRTIDGRSYRRVEYRPPDPALSLIQAVPNTKVQTDLL